ncbi:uncharacterized protein [Drosophila pseudoobscura]|uniref:Uncharacterized protein isoform X4 n=1 Tax=Drosophila pseudoobscura pseudoobscura TaxID=46245 RepID=A0A6I8W7K2_DROPS|nr:uncharacterized protein LOC26533050 isoform X4 [Drosophila pseudoobscura]XP_033239354.1 uncharacterized protein LOC26533050 isoform X4 [Drosophila pseudoobscura]XP_033239355.1 uncharacterized protein LOC26533050 isoform X5 [Drosophila pseudoobscura]XP_033239356.1 uncharacterized protein LOC26533050 isoform X6 [Drosophila pseudoobscura]
MVILQTKEGHRDGTWNIRSVIPSVWIYSGFHQYQINIMQRDQDRINHYIKHRERRGKDIVMVPGISDQLFPQFGYTVARININNHHIKHYIKHREREGRKWKDGDPSDEGRTS